MTQKKKLAAAKGELDGVSCGQEGRAATKSN